MRSCRVKMYSSIVMFSISGSDDSSDFSKCLQNIIHFCSNETESMEFIKYVNYWKRMLFASIAGSMVSPHQDIQMSPKTKPMPARILISRPNHRLGNLLLITPILQELSYFPTVRLICLLKETSARSYLKIIRTLMI
jgi:hypothetical protein